MRLNSVRQLSLLICVPLISASLVAEEFPAITAGKPETIRAAIEAAAKGGGKQMVVPAASAMAPTC